MNKSEAYKKLIKILSTRQDILSKTILDYISITDFDSWNDDHIFTDKNIEDVLFSLSCKFEINGGK
jgi:hypothetical protein